LKASVVSPDKFCFDGRGPSLVRAVWDPDYGTRLLAIEYLNPGDSERDLKHVRFFGVQVVMFTPEEVIGLAQMLDSVRESHAAALDYGRSDWLRSFDQQHLAKCRHYKLLFYDDLLDVICERVEFFDESFMRNATSPD
jgi:hypothetical protein